MSKTGKNKWKIDDIVCSNICRAMIGKITEIYKDNTCMILIGNRHIYADLRYWSIIDIRR